MQKAFFHRISGGVFACLTLLLLLGSSITLGQMVFGSIFGTVTDQSGAAIPGAKVVITEVNKNVRFETATNENGNYTRAQLVPGVYRVEVQATGFRSAINNAVTVSVDAAVRVDFEMTVGEVTESIEVTAEAPLMKSDRADVSTTYSGAELENLPNLGRNTQSFTLLNPGTQKLQWQHASSENPQGSVQIMVNGQHFSGTNYLLDGTDNQDPILGIIVINPTEESISEMKFTSQNYDAEFGQSIAGVMTVQTKSGTNEIHGSAFEYLRNNSPDFQSFARDPFNAAENDGTPPFKWNQFGGSAGGPIKKNKLFAFGDVQITRQRAGTSGLTNVPTLKARQGDFSEYLEPLANAPMVQTTSGRMVPLQRNMIFDPLTGDPVTGEGRLAFDYGGVLNRIPPSRLSPQALNLLRLLPEPNTADPSGSPFRRNFSTIGSEKIDSEQYNTRWDYHLSEKYSLYGRYTFAEFEKDSPTIFGDGGGLGLGEGGFGGLSDVRNQSLAVGFTWTISPTILNETRFGFQRYRVNVLPRDIGTSPARDAGIPGLNLDDFFTSGLPAIFIKNEGRVAEQGDDVIGSGDDVNFGSALGVNRCNCPLDQQENVFQWVNNTTMIKGDHTIKFGGDLRYATNLRVPSDVHRSGELTFDPGYTGFVRGTNVSAGLGLATFALGEVTGFGRFVSPNTDARERQKRFYWYGQDTWRVTPKFTLTLGIRWEQVFPETVNEPGNGANLDLRTGELAVFGVGGVSDHGIQDMKWTNLAPRVGVTYQITPKSVVRAGYGWSYALGTFGTIFGHNVTQNLPVLAAQNLNRRNDFSSVFSLADGPAAPVFPEPGANGRFPLPNGVTGNARPDDVRLPRVMAYNATFQQQLTKDLSVEIGYVGNSGRHVFTGDGPNFNANEPAFVPGVQDTNIRRPFFNRFGWTQSINYFCNCANSRYDSLQIQVNKRMSAGLQLKSNYTYGRGLQDAGSFEFLYNRDLGYSAGDFDRRHQSVTSLAYELPYGRGRRWGANASRLLDGIFGSWTITSITTIYSGRPFEVTFDNPDPTQFIRPNAGPGNRPDRGPGDPFAIDQNRDHFFRGGLGDAFLIPPNNEFGNLGRNALRGPSLFQQDLSVSKTFDITERINIRLRVEAFNAFNTTNLGQPNGNVTSGDAGRISSLAAGTQMRRLQFGLRLGF